MSSIFSMTGYAAVRRHTAAGELGISLRTVNGRNLDLHFHLNSEFAPFENALRRCLKSHVRRGHIEIRVSLLPAPGVAASYNRELLARYISAFRAAQKEFGIRSEPDLNKLLVLPGVLEGLPAGAPALHEADVMAVLNECVLALNQFREREGAELAAAITGELDQIELQVTSIAEIRAEALPVLQSRMAERLKTLLSESNFPATRLIEEAAILADRSDIHEELTRLGVHAREVRRLLEEGGEIGKRLDFLMQEMNREANTILSKSSGIGQTGLSITNLGIALKANIERIREQSLNLE